MKEYPICFNDEMVRAILDGRKTQTRQPMRPQPPNGATEVCVELVYGEWVATYRAFSDGGSARHAICACPFGGPGDRLWVREAWGITAAENRNQFDRNEVLLGDYQLLRRDVALAAYYRASDYVPDMHWRRASHMPREMSRIDLAVKRVWVERVQDITERDAYAEGVDSIPSAPAALTHRTSFRGLWDSIYAKKGFGWDENPWVWVGEFEQEKTEEKP